MDTSLPGALDTTSSSASSPLLSVSKSSTLSYLISLSHFLTIICTLVSITRTTSFIFHLRDGPYARHFSTTASKLSRQHIKLWVCYGTISFSAVLLQGYLGALGFGWIAVILRGALLTLMTITFEGSEHVRLMEYGYKKVGELFEVCGKDLESWFLHVGQIWRDIERESGEWAKGVLEWIAAGGLGSLANAGVESGNGNGRVVGGTRKRWRGESTSSDGSGRELFGGDIKEKIRVLREGLEGGKKGRFITLKRTPIPKSRHEIIRETREILRRRTVHGELAKGKLGK